MDAYGAGGRVGGGAYSGKDPTKVDRSAAYMARHIAKTIVASGTAAECEVELAYAIGVASPLAVNIDTKGTGKIKDGDILAAVLKVFDLRPRQIAEYLGLNAPIYEATASGGHYGREEFPWEQISKADEFLSEVKGCGIKTSPKSKRKKSLAVTPDKVVDRNIEIVGKNN